MTAIACRDGYMAADSGVWQGDLCLGYTTKIRRLSDGTLAAAAGSRPMIEAFHLWIAGDGPKPEKVDRDEFAAIWLKNDGIWLVSYKLEIYKTPFPFAAEGVLAEFMYGAMAAGASAKDAVTLAVCHCSYVAGEVQVERLV